MAPAAGRRFPFGGVMQLYWPEKWVREMQRFCIHLGGAEQARREYIYFRSCWDLDDGETMLSLAVWQLHNEGRHRPGDIRNITRGMRRLLVEKGYIDRVGRGMETKYVFSREGLLHFGVVDPPLTKPDAGLEKINIKRHDAEWNI